VCLGRIDQEGFCGALESIKSEEGIREKEQSFTNIKKEDFRGRC